MKKILLLFMAILTLGATASAQDLIQVFQDGDWTYTINPDAEHEVTVVHYAAEEDESKVIEVTIPSYATYNGSSYCVTELGDFLFSFYNNYGQEGYTHWWQHETYTNLEKVTIPNTVTRIGVRAFEYCTSLTSIDIPGSVTEIGDYSFEGCTSLISIEIPGSVTKIGFSTFKGCTGLTSIDIPDSVTEINYYAFEGCTGLTSVTIPKSVISMGANPFRNCSSLQEIIVEEGNPGYKSIDGAVYNSRLTIFLIYPAGKEGAFEIPNSVTFISSSAFEGCTGLTSIDIPGSVTYIENSAFKGCTGLTSVNIPESVTSINNSSFEGCTGLTSVTIPESVTKIRNSAFAGCTSLTSINIPEFVTELGSSAFAGCTNLTTIFALPVIPPTCNKSPFSNVPETAVVYIPKGSFNAYFVADGWSHFTDFREMGVLNITLSESNISIEEGETVKLSADVTKDNDVTIKSETWASSNPGVATVDNEGVVTAVSEGTASISFTVVDSYGCPHTEYCEVKVAPGSGVEGIEVDGSDAPAEYFTLNGTRVDADTLSPGLYIKRQGGKAVKVMVR